MNAVQNANADLGFYWDKSLVVISAGLLYVGYLVLISSSMYIGDQTLGNPMHYPQRQLVNIGLALVLAYLVSFVPMYLWERYAAWLFLGGLILLLMVLIPGIGIKVNGSYRWLSIFGVRVQVSEMVKLLTVIYMARYVTRYQEDFQNTGLGMVKPLGVLGIACIFLLMEPDFGSAVMIMTIAMGIMFLAGVRLGAFLALISGLAISAALLIFLAGYRMDRIVAFLDPWSLRDDKGYQLVHALIAFGRGEVVGVGLGNSIQKMSHLPEAHTDFLFSVFAEEFGLIGVVLIIAVYMAFIYRSFMIGAFAEQKGQLFSAFVAYGIAIWFGFQAFINIGVNMGVVPTKGWTLPLMSYGGGSMLMMCSAVALLLRIQHESYHLPGKVSHG